MLILIMPDDCFYCDHGYKKVTSHENVAGKDCRGFTEREISA